MGFQCSLYSTVQAIKTSINLLFHFRVNGPVDDFHSSFHQRLMGWFVRPRRQGCHRIMADKISEGLVQCGFILTAFDHRRLQVISDNRLWNSTEEVQCVFTGTNKVLLLLAATGFDIGQLAGTKDRHKNLSFYEFSCKNIQIMQLFTGIIHVHLLSCFVINVHCWIAGPFPTQKMSLEL